MSARSAATRGEAFDIGGYRGALFLAILLVACGVLTPFPDLGAEASVELGTGNDVGMYAAFAIMAAIAGAMVWQTDRPALKCLRVPTFLALAGWVAVTCLTSQDVTTSVKRVALAGFAALCGIALFLLPRDRDELARLLATVALIIVAMSYFGVLFMPQFAIHQATDLGEPQLAGDWRGLFGHKNMASAIFSILSFVGLFVIRTGRREGWIILVLSLVFVAASGGKSSTGICLATLALSALAMRTGSPVLWSLIVFLPLFLLNLLGVGSVLVPQLSAVSAALPLDTTFTGRTDVWALAVARIPEKLLFGHGIGAFWNTESLRYGMEQSTLWAGNARHAHNGYLDAVLSMGLPGLALLVAAFVIQPARDIRRCMARGNEPALTLMVLQIWMFGLYLSSLESFFFDRADALWIIFLFAVFGIRYLASFRVTR